MDKSSLSNITKLVSDYNLLIKNDVHTILNNVSIDLDELKSGIVGDYIDQKETDDHDLGMIISFTGKYTEMKSKLKEDAEKFMKLKYDSWCKSLENLFNIIQETIVNTVDSSALTPTDFTGTENVAVVNASSPKKRNITSLYPNLDDFDVEEHMVMKKKKQTPVKNTLASQKPRRSVVFSPVVDQRITPSFEEDDDDDIEVPKSQPAVNRRRSFGRPKKLEDDYNNNGEEEGEEMIEAPEPEPSPPINRRKSVGRSKKKETDFITVQETPPLSGQVRTRKSVVATPDNDKIKKNQRRMSQPSFSPSEPEDNYSHLWNRFAWHQLTGLPSANQIPELPAVYQLKVKQAKKSAYIGFCSNLRQELLKYSNAQSSGNKQLDKFIERNRDNIEVQCQVFESVDAAKQKQKDNLNAFHEKFFRIPVYN